MRPDIVFGCPIANRSWVIDRWWSAINGKQVVDQQWSTVFMYSPSEDDTLAKLCALEGDVTILEAVEEIRTREEMDLHRWPETHFEHMSRWRNALLDHCEKVGAEWFFSVDSDIILPPMTAQRLQAVLGRFSGMNYGAIAPAVNMAVHIDAHAYNFMQWNPQSTDDAYRPTLPMPNEPFTVGVIMGAMLIHRSAFHVRWEAHPQGEDLGWSRDAQRKDVRLLLDPTIQCNHLMKRRD